MGIANLKVDHLTRHVSEIAMFRTQYQRIMPMSKQSIWLGSIGSRHSLELESELMLDKES